MEQRYGCKGKAAWRPNLFQLSTSLQGLENMHEFSIRRFARLTGNTIHPQTPCVQTSRMPEYFISSSSGTTSGWVSRLCPGGCAILSVTVRYKYRQPRVTPGTGGLSPCWPLLASICVLIIDLSLSHEMTTKRTVSEYQSTLKSTTGLLHEAKKSAQHADSISCRPNPSLCHSK